MDFQRAYEAASAINSYVDPNIFDGTFVGFESDTGSILNSFIEIFEDDDFSQQVHVLGRVTEFNNRKQVRFFQNAPSAGNGVAPWAPEIGQTYKVYKTAGASRTNNGKVINFDPDTQVAICKVGRTEVEIPFDQFVLDSDS